MQANATPALISLFNWISFLADPFTVTFSIIAMFLLVGNKFRLLVIVIFFLTNVYLLGETKALYAESRPYWSNIEIKSLQWYCPMDYGNPSGHSWLSGTLYYLLVIEYGGSGPYHSFLLIPVILALIVPLSRMYLGAHSANQVLQGIVNCFAMLVIYRYGMHNFIRDWVNCFLKLSKRFKHYLECTILAHVVILIIPMLCYVYNRTYTLPAHEIQNIIDKCNVSGEVTEKIDEKLMLMSCLIHLVFGLLYGISRMGTNFRFYFGLWRYTPDGSLMKKRVQKVLLGDLLFMLPALLGWMLAKFIVNPYIQYIVMSFGMLSAGYIYSAFAALWMVKYDII
jgi:membrane-associated phospholipid phosphatase